MSKFECKCNILLGPILPYTFSNITYFITEFGKKSHLGFFQLISLVIYLITQCSFKKNDGYSGTQ